jgi:CTP-dependent riboflavin kinase
MGVGFLSHRFLTRPDIDRVPPSEVSVVAALGATMNKLVFSGNVVNGIGRHSELIVPGRNNLEHRPPDWPEILFRGSLNVRVHGYPPEFAQRGLPNSVVVLDTAGFLPEFTIPQAKMLNNQLTANAGAPLRGTAQVWRAWLSANGDGVACWVLRRIGSGLRDQIELVAGTGLRNTLGLSRDKIWPAVVTIDGSWRPEGGEVPG